MSERELRPDEIAAVLNEVATLRPELRRVCELTRELYGNGLPELSPWERDAIIERIRAELEKR